MKNATFDGAAKRLVKLSHALFPDDEGIKREALMREHKLK